MLSITYSTQSVSEEKLSRKLSNIYLLPNPNFRILVFLKVAILMCYYYYTGLQLCEFVDFAVFDNFNV